MYSNSRNKGYNRLSTNLDHVYVYLVENKDLVVLLLDMSILLLVHKYIYTRKEKLLQYTYAVNMYYILFHDNVCNTNVRFTLPLKS
jgi:hypothetical protein